MSRARIVCSEILSRMSPINHFDEKMYPNLNASQEKIFNLCLNECSTGEVFVETPDVSNVLSEMNTTVVDDWFKPKASSSMDCIDTAYLNDENFLSTKDPDMCSSDIGLELVLVNKEQETNLNYCGMTEKNNDLDCTDPLLNLMPMNEVLLRKTEIKCDKDLYASDSELNLTKGRPLWDTLSIASRKSDCDGENNGDFADFNLLSFSFDTNDHIHSLENIGDNVIKNNNKNVLSDKLETISIIESSASSLSSITTTITNKVFEETSTKQNSSNITNKKTTNTKRPNILRTSKVKSSDVNQDTSNRTKNVDKNMNVDEDPLSIDNDDSIFNFANDSEFIILPEELNDPLSISVSNTVSLNEEEKRIMKKHHICELNNMTGAVAVVSNSTVNSKSKTKITIKTKNGEEKYEGNTAELTEAVGTTRKNRRPNTPVEGEHIVTSVKTATSLKEEKKNYFKLPPEPEDRLVKEMLSVLGITDDMLFTILTNLGLRMWVCPEMECRRIFNRLNSLKTHILSHYGLKPFKVF